MLMISSLAWLLLVPLIFVWRQKEALKEENTKLRLLEVQLKNTIEERERGYNEKMALIEETKEKLKESFQSISKDTLEVMQKKNDEEWGKKEEFFLAKTLNPVKESLSKLDQGMRAIEKERKGEKEQLKEQL